MYKKEPVWDYRCSRSRSPAAPVTIGNINVDKTDNYEYLGITVDTQFKFNVKKLPSSHTLQYHL